MTHSGHLVKNTAFATGTLAALLAPFIRHKVMYWSATYGIDFGEGYADQLLVFVVSGIIWSVSAIKMMFIHPPDWLLKRFNKDVQ